ncbi:MAG: transposase [Candidatus Riflebacteria bacterium]|nr:transposase [Candidatus Riflebacteria bacterium]
MTLGTDIQDAARTLNRRGLSIRAVARALHVSRNAARNALRGKTALQVVGPQPPEITAEHPRLEIFVRLLFKECDGSAQRVQECLEEQHGITMGYSTLTRYLRNLGLRQPRRGRKVSGEIITGPGVEGQLDTSPVHVRLGLEIFKLYMAHLILGFSRHRYMEFFARWTRFHAMVFIVHALFWFKGLPRRMGIDNGREIIILGSGVNGVVALEMERFAERLGFEFAAIELEHKDRQGKVEKAHQYGQSNFLINRPACNLADLNAQAREWCEKVFHKRVRGQTFAPADRWEEDLAHLQPVPLHVPEPSITRLCRADDRARVWLNGSSYRVPDRYVLRRGLLVRETGDQVIVFDGRTEVCRHSRTPECERKHSPLVGYPDRKPKRPPQGRLSAEEVHLRSFGPDVAQYLDALESRPIRYSYARLRRLYKLSHAYPREIFVETLKKAVACRAFDLKVVAEALELKMAHRIQDACLTNDPELEARPAYRKGQVTPHRLQPDPPVEDAVVDDALGEPLADPVEDEEKEDERS